jgi:hypothetical protein
MAEEDDIAKQKIQEKIAEKLSKLNQSSAKAYREQLKALNNNNSALETFQNLLEDINTRIEDQHQGFAGLLTQIKKINEELGSENKFVNDATKAFRGLESIASRLKDDQKGYTDLNIKQLKQEKSKLKSLEDQAKEAAKQIAIDKKIVDLAHVNLSDIHDLSEEQRAILTAAQENFSVYKRTNELLEERIKEEKKVNRTLGLTKVALEGLGKIPIVGPLLDTNEALDAAKAKAKAGGGAFASMSAAMGSIGKSLLSSLADPLAMIGLLVKGFQMLLELGFATDKTIVSLQKSLYLSREGAIGLHNAFHSMSKNSTVLVDGLNSAFVNVPNQTEAMMQLSDAMGGVSMATLEEIQNQILLTKQMGFTAEEGQALYVLGRQNKMTASEIVDEIESQVEAYKKQSGVLLNTKKITSEVSTINGQLRLQYKNNVTQLTAAVIQSNKLGFSLKQSKDIAEGLLNFEQSIENELSAELLLGRGLNLEQARLLALNGESAKATALIAENMGGSAGFTALNVVQQDALSKALNMTSDELANSMLYQENLAKLGEEEKQRAIEQLDYLKSIGDEEAAQQLQRAIAAGTDIDAALKASTIQDRFYANVEKIKKSIGQIAEGPAMKLAESLSNMVGNTFLLKSILAVVAGLMVTMAVSAAIMNPAAAIAGLAVIGGAAIIGGVSALAEKPIPQKKRLGGSVSGFGTGDIIPALLEPKEYVIPNSPGKTGTEKYNEMISSNKTKGTNSSNNQDSPSLITAINNLASRPIHVSVGKTGTEKYNEMISTSSPTMLNEGDKVYINPNKNTGTNSSNNQYSPAMLAAINELNSNVIALASRPILVSTQIDNKELILSSLKLPEIRGIVNTSDTYAMGSGPNPNTPI